MCFERFIRVVHNRAHQNYKLPFPVMVQSENKILAGTMISQIS